MNTSTGPVKFASCKTCKGSGECQNCEGSGSVVIDDPRDRSEWVDADCVYCDASGECVDCNGRGELEVGYER